MLMFTFPFTKEVATIIDVWKERQIIVLKSEARNCSFGLNISKKKLEKVEVKDVKGIVTYLGKFFIKFKPFKF